MRIQHNNDFVIRVKGISAKTKKSFMKQIKNKIKIKIR